MNKIIRAILLTGVFLSSVLALSAAEPLPQASTTAGNAWKQTGNVILDVFALALDPDTQTLYAASIDTNQVLSLDLTAQNNHWEVVGGTNPFNQSVVSLLFDENTSTLYAGTRGADSRVYRLDIKNPAAVWEHVGENSPGGCLINFALDSEKQILYVGDCLGAGVSKLKLNKETKWTPVGSNVPSKGGVYGLVLDEQSQTLYAGAFTHDCRSTENGVFSLDLKHNQDPWMQVSGSAPGNGNIAPLLFDKSSGRLFTGVVGNSTIPAENGVFSLKIQKGNARWETVGAAPTPLPGTGAVQSLLLNGNTLYAGTGSGFCFMGDEGVWRTHLEGNKPWSIITSEGFPANTPSISMVVDPRTNILYVSTFSGVFQIQL